MTDAIRQGITWVPIESTWEAWNGNMLHYFGEEPIPYLPDETQWKTVAEAVVGLPTFSNYAPPDPDLFDNWRDWTLALRIAINGPTI